jgi:alpha-glucosidase
VAFDAGPMMASIAHETALSVVFESGGQHLADRPEAYDKRPNALAFLDQVPTVWDETRLLSGTPGKDIVIARRSGKRWFIGGIRGGADETLHLSLAALGNGPWLVDTIEDAAGEGRGDVVHRTVHEAGAALDFPVKKDGGFAAVACPAAAGRSSCYDPL